MNNLERSNSIESPLNRFLVGPRLRTTLLSPPLVCAELRSLQTRVGEGTKNSLCMVMFKLSEKDVSSRLMWGKFSKS